MTMAEEILRVENLHVKVEDTPILNGIDLTIHRGEIHVIMGRNGAGKSTLASVIMGHPAYEITQGSIHYMGTNIEEMSVFERARAGMFLSFQYPAVIPGVQVGTFLKKSVQSVREEELKGREFRKELNAAMKDLEMEKSVLSRYVNDGFSGGEKKRLKSFKCSCSNPRWRSLMRRTRVLTSMRFASWRKASTASLPKQAASSSPINAFWTMFSHTSFMS